MTTGNPQQLSGKMRKLVGRALRRFWVLCKASSGNTRENFPLALMLRPQVCWKSPSGTQSFSPLPVHVLDKPLTSKDRLRTQGSGFLGEKPAQSST